MSLLNQLNFFAERCSSTATLISIKLVSYFQSVAKCHQQAAMGVDGYLLPGDGSLDDYSGQLDVDVEQNDGQRHQSGIGERQEPLTEQQDSSS